MSSISSLSAAVSALMSSQTALNTTAHNLANVNTTGYVRQQILMNDSRYMNPGRNNTTGFYVGLGVDIQQIRQVRDRFLDENFRQENSRKGFYEAKAASIEEVETILGEIEGESFANVINSLWTSINELAKNPEGLETRGSLVQNAVLFVNRANLTMQQLKTYQENMNTQISDMVTQINQIGEEIYQLNDVIVKRELSGGNANDYRDQRNKLLDNLSTIADITYKEDMRGNVLVQIEGSDFVTLGGYNRMGLDAAAPFSQLVKPVWEHLPTGINDVFEFGIPINSESNNDKGKLKGLLLARGTGDADWTDMQNPAIYESTIKPSLIMNAQAQFDNLIHGIVTTINDILAPNIETIPGVYELDVANAPFDRDGIQGTELFVRKSMDRYSAGVYNQEDAANPYSLYSAGNIEINPLILQDYDKLCLSGSVDELSDSSYVKSILDKWQEPFSPIEPGLVSELSFNEYYNEFVSGIGNTGNATNNKISNQELMVTQISNQRSSLHEVSSDEELTNMMKFQHAYNAASKVIVVLDEMIGQIVQSTGLVGR